LNTAKATQAKGDVIMAEQDKEAQSQQEQASEPETQGEAKAEETNWEERYKNLESDHTKTAQELAEHKQLIETVTPFVDWGKVQGEEGHAEEGEQKFVDEKTHTQSLKELSSDIDIKLLTLEFRQDHPELKPYEGLVGFNLLNNTNKNEPVKQRMAEAVKMTQEFLEKERNAGKEEAEKKAQEAAGAGGLGSAGASSPEKKEASLGESNAEYIARRKEQSRKARGLI